MNVLMFSRDRTAFQDKSKIMYGDFRDRILEYSKYAEIHVISCSENRGTKKLAENITLYSALPNPLYYLFSSLATALKIACSNRIDVITCQDPFVSGIAAVIAKELLRKPLVVQLHADFLDNPHWLKERKANHILNVMGKLIVKRADVVRTVSIRISEYVKKELGVEKVYEAPVYTDVSKFVNNKEKPLPKFSSFDTRVLFIGRLVKQKNVGLLIAAAKIVLKDHPNTAFIIVGGGPEAEKLRDMAAEERNIFFEGPVPSTLPYYATCDIFALPSNYEGWGLVLVEAMASGKPVVTTDVGCVGEIVIDKKNGFVVNSDPKEMADAINRLIADKALRETIGLRAQKTVLDKISKEKNAKQFMEILETASKTKR